MTAQPQTTLDLRPDEPIRVPFERIFAKAASNAEKGRWFEHLFMSVARELPDFQVADIWTWREWPQRLELTGLDGRDTGIDLVARLTNGSLVAVQCKCYDRDHRVAKPDVDSFISASDGEAFDLRWVVSTCPWNANAESAIRNKRPEVRRIDFLDYLDRTILELGKPAEKREPKPLQERAIEAVVDGLAVQGHERGKLVMACGTGKTFTALRIAERLVPDDGRIIFAAPTISLVSQARREWLTHSVRTMSALVVCSDSTAGGKGERHEAGPDSLVCPVLTNPSHVAQHLTTDSGVKVVFCTYHSLRVVVEAQREHGGPRFDLAVADEAHRTTGIDVEDRKVNFQDFHHRLSADRRIYMTATERIYKERSKSTAKKKGLEVVDMSDLDTYGPLLHKLKFKEAVAAGELSDYRVIVLGVHESHLTPGIRRSLADADPRAKVDDSDLLRLYGTALAMNGYVRGGAIEVPDRLPRTLAFASRINRSQWFAHTLATNRTLKGQITRRLEGDVRALDMQAVHLDASNSAIERGAKLRWLNDAKRANESRMICNVRLFTEGVDVPALDAVSFLDPRTSQIDIVQSVGRVMRKAEGKRFGYIVVPVALEEGEDVVGKLEKRDDDYRAIGQVLRALQSHDERLAEATGKFVTAHQTKPLHELPPGQAPEDRDEIRERERQTELDLELTPVDAASIFTHLGAASGLGKPGQMTAETIEDAVKLAAAYFMEDGAILGAAREVLELPAAEDKEIATVAALLLCNACLLHKRLKSDSDRMAALAGLDGVACAKDPVERLRAAWEVILEQDYEPVFRPALALLERFHRLDAAVRVPPPPPNGSRSRLPPDRHDDASRRDNAKKAVQVLAERAESLADSLNELGYDHAGPLYHRILGSATSDGAFYTNNVSALMLAGLVLSPDLVDWSDYEAVTGLRIFDPACGTGTLLMAALKTIKDRGLEHGAFDEDSLRQAHKDLVERSIHGVDINYHATQLAASNLTLGAPSVSYEAMSVHTLQHGPQADGTIRLGSLDLLRDVVHGRKPDLFGYAKTAMVVDRDRPSRPRPVQDLLRPAVVVMNPPFTANDKRGRKYNRTDLKRMQREEQTLRELIAEADPEAGALIDFNSVRTFFTPLADALLRKDKGVLGKILPTTACTSTSGLAERRFLASRFHVDVVVTTHDPKRPNFSENTSIHESLVVCRRKTRENAHAPTLFVSLAHKLDHPSEIGQLADWLAAVHGRWPHEWHALFKWPEERMAAGDWSPAQWFDGALAYVAEEIEALPGLTPLGEMALVEPAGRRIADAFVNPLRNEPRPEYPVMWRHQTGKRTTMRASADYVTEPKAGKGAYARGLWPKASRLLVAAKLNPQAVRTASVLVDEPALGNAWVPVMPLGDSALADPNEQLRSQKAWCAFLNSTPGAVLFLNRRSKKLTYPAYSLDQLRSLPCPDPGKVRTGYLAATFDELQHRELLPWTQMDCCPVRARLDAVVGQMLDIKPAKLAEWRRRLVQEPTISNKKRIVGEHA